MAQNVTVAGASYSDVPSVVLPKTGGGTATFLDTTISSNAAAASDIASGKLAYVNGSLVEGTAVGGGAITVTTTQDSHGGDIVTITAVDISDTTAVASDVASGKYFYSAAGVKTAGTASGGGGATQHTIHLEFTDSTDTDINVYYDDSLLGTMITAYDPLTYDNKTVDSAALDNVVWYQRPTVTWETLWENSATNIISDTPYNYFWLSSLSDVYPTAGSVWRVTIDNNVYQCTAASASTSGGNITCFGNPKYSGGTDNGSNATFNFYNAGWGALTGDTEVTAGNHYVKIERQVSA